MEDTMSFRVGDEGAKCHVCNKKFDVFIEPTIYFGEDLSKLMKTRRDRQKIIRKFAMIVNALLNKGSGFIVMHAAPGVTRIFEEQIRDIVASMIPDGSLFSENYESWTVDDVHTFFRVKLRERPIATLDFNLKIPTSAGLCTATYSQMVHLLTREIPSDVTGYSTSQFDTTKHTVGQKISFHEDIKTQFKDIEEPLVGGGPGSNRVSKLHCIIWNSLQLAKYISAFSTLHTGGSVFFGIREKSKKEPRWNRTTKVPGLVLKDGEECWVDVNDVDKTTIHIAKEEHVPTFRFRTSEFICHGVPLTGEEQEALSCGLDKVIRTDLLWYPISDGNRELISDYQNTVELKFHNVYCPPGDDKYKVAKETCITNIFVIEIRVNYFHGLCFLSKEGPEAYKLTQCIRDQGHVAIQRISISEWRKCFTASFPQQKLFSELNLPDSAFTSLDLASTGEEMDENISEHEDRIWGIPTEQMPPTKTFFPERMHGQEINVEPVPLAEIFTSYPLFSKTWLCSGIFTRKGGLLQTKESDVCLQILEDAILMPRDATDAQQEAMNTRETDGQFRDTKTVEATGTDAQREKSRSIGKPATDGIEIKMAVSTDLERAERELELENIASPIAEFYAGENFSFNKVVRIFLPHFLPANFEEDNVEVYQFHRDVNGFLYKKALPKLDYTEIGSAKSKTDERQGAFYFNKKREIYVLTTHFSGVVVCSSCNAETSPPQLHLFLYGKQVKRETVEVDLKLLVGDKRLECRDFRRDSLPNSKDEDSLISKKVLKPVQDTSGIEVGVVLDFEREKWMHKFCYKSGISKLSAVRYEDLESFLTCCKRATDIDWAFKLRDDLDETRRWWFDCTVEVGYITEHDNVCCEQDELPFFAKPKKQTFMVNGLTLIDDQMSKSDEEATRLKLVQTPSDPPDNPNEEGAVGGQACELNSYFPSESTYPSTAHIPKTGQRGGADRHWKDTPLQYPFPGCTSLPSNGINGARNNSRSGGQDSFHQNSQGAQSMAHMATMHESRQPHVHNTYIYGHEGKIELGSSRSYNSHVVGTEKTESKSECSPKSESLSPEERSGIRTGFPETASMSEIAHTGLDDESETLNLQPPVQQADRNGIASSLDRMNLGEEMQETANEQRRFSTPVQQSERGDQTTPMENQVSGSRRE